MYIYTCKNKYVEPNDTNQRQFCKRVHVIKNLQKENKIRKFKKTVRNVLF